MNAEKWQKIDEVFHAALEINPAERASFLSLSCENDLELQKEIESLLASHDDSSKFLSENAFEVGARVFAETSLLPEVIGEYKILREIGRGGFGAVFLALKTEGEFAQKVALKIIKRGMDTDEIVRRFRQERQVLAALNHPFITKLLDGGTTRDGLPYLVMEYVEGIPLNEFCARQSLSLNERLELFRKVCAAVSYAHQNLVVHRDLKPSNILITADNVPKLLDFGIAKILSDETDSTKTTTRIFTPEYASPEQKAGGKITTATDVYSLGVLLSEMVQNSKFKIQNSKSSSSFKFSIPEWFRSVVSGRRAENGETKGKVKEQNTDREGQVTNPYYALRLSSLARDLAKITQMATHAEAERRYASVGDLSEDVRRFQSGFPVAAEQDSFLYRAEKFVRRHKIGFAAGALASVSLVSGFSVAVWQAHLASVEKAKAERRFNDVRALASSFLFEFHDAIKDTAGTYEARRLVVTKALEYLKKLESETDDTDTELLKELSLAYNRVGDAQANSLKENESALESFRNAAEIDGKILRLNPNDVETKKRLADNLYKCGETLVTLGRASEAVLIYKEAAALHEENVQAEPGNLGELLNLSGQLSAVAETLVFLQQTDEAETFFRRALRVTDRRIEMEAAPTTGLTFAWMGRGDLLKQLKDLSGAAESYKKATEIAEKALQANPGEIQAFRNLSASHRDLGEALDELGDVRGALENFQICLDLLRKKAAEIPNDAQIRHAEAYYTVRVAAEKEKIGDKPEALRLVRQGLRLREQLANHEDAAFGYSKFYHAELFEMGADLLVKLKQNAEAREIYRKALQIYSEITPVQTQSADLTERKSRLQQKINAL